jgi:membrane associated rhomboid family serine protease
MLFPLFDHNPTRRAPVITILLILVNLGVHWRVSQLPELEFVRVLCERGFVPNRLTRVDNPQPLIITLDLQDEVRQPRRRGRPPQAQAPEPRAVRVQLSTDSGAVFLTLFTTMFLHGGWFHLLSNMWMLWVFGNNIEDRLGSIVFVAFYLVGGIIATLAQWAIDPTGETPMVGASGAVAAALGAYALTFPWAKVRTLVFIGFPFLMDLPALLVLGAWLVLETIMGVVAVQMAMEVGVAHWAHIGGFVAGACIMPLLSIGSSPPGEDWRKEAEQQFDFSTEGGPRTRRDDDRNPYADDWNNFPPR